MIAMKTTYDTLRHDLESKMIQASTLPTQPERKGFINRTFSEIHKAYQEKQVNHAEYIRLVNQLAVFKRGQYNDYLDVLVGAAQVGMLETVIQAEIAAFSPEEAKKRSHAITELTNIEPVDIQEEK